MKEEYICIIADENLINKKFDQEIDNHLDKEEWLEYKKHAIRNQETRIVYMGLLNGEIITECTAIISDKDLDMQNKENLVGDKIAYLTAFRTNKEYEGMGYFSKLYNFMENDLQSRGFERLTLGVEPSETRNISIYFKWGFIDYIKSDYEEIPDSNEQSSRILVNYYGKNISNH